MDDDLLVTYVESGLDLLALLETVIPALESRAEFIRAFNEAYISGGEHAGQVKTFVGIRLELALSNIHIGTD